MDKDQKMLELLEKMEKNSRKQVFFARIQFVVTVIALACCVMLLLSCVKIYPQLQETAKQAEIESHCVNYDALVANDFDTYFIERAKKLLTLIENAMGKPVSDRDAETTIDQFGASLL